MIKVNSFLAGAIIYPNTLKRAKSALKLAHNAPRPAGIKAAVYRKYIEQMRSWPIDLGTDFQQNL